MLLKTRDDFDEMIQQFIAKSYKVAKLFPHHEGHHTLATVLSTVPNIQDVLYIAWQMGDVGGTCSTRKAWSYEKVEQLFRNLGFGDINRFHVHGNMRVYFDNRDITMFVNNLCLFVLRESMMCCATKNCGVKITDNIWGAIGFEHDHVMDNDPKEGKARTKRKNCWLLNMPIMDLLEELAKTQLKCRTCHLKITNHKYATTVSKKFEEKKRKAALKKVEVPKKRKAAPKKKMMDEWEESSKSSEDEWEESSEEELSKDGDML